jgi:aerobic carbon-monoxide dehydrogenase medium subunit
MKPGRFEYRAPTSLDEVLAELARNPEEARVLAGGQSLVPAMNFRLADPAILIDLNRLGGLNRVRKEGPDLVIEALVRHQDLHSPVVDDSLGRLLARMSRFVGHLPIRVRGTFVGSVAHADPAAEWCMLAAALDATIVAQSVRGERRLRGSDFFEGPFTTNLAPDEVIVEVCLPLLGRAGVGFHEQSRTAGDFATVAAVATLKIENGKVAEAHLGIAGAEGRPVRATAAEDTLLGEEPTAGTLAAAGRAAADGVEPLSDALCSADYRRHLVAVLATRALGDALDEAVA